MKEAKEAEVNLQDEDPELIESMLVYLYSLQYPEIAAGDRSEDSLLIDAKLYAVADRYDVPDLKDAIADAFEMTLHVHMNLGGPMKLV